MRLECEEFDEYVPVNVLLEFTKEFLRGFLKLMKEVGFDKDKI
jgi:hypothetical protein